MNNLSLLKSKISLVNQIELPEEVLNNYEL